MSYQTNPANSQGKVLFPVLETLAQSRTLVSVAPKHINQISSELFTFLSARVAFLSTGVCFGFSEFVEKIYD
ncbi:MAG: hypothetical protein BMS9Abin31_0973 [Gammaproteobacteria bacterium]|nr:MAG: hypothetical protein BMS9Abin31_0973 [Gammaproteobacteria bacterium]